MSDTANLPAALALCGPVEWPAGALILHQGDVPSLVYFLERGIIKLTHVTEGGDEHVVDIRQAPAWVGVAFVLARAPMSFNVTTTTDCVVRWCTVPGFTDLLADSRHTREIQRLLSTEIIGLTDRITALTLRSSQERLRRFLSEFLPQVSTDADVAQLPFKQSDVAAFINISPEHLSRLLKRMKKAELSDRDLTSIKWRSDSHRCGGQSSSIACEARRSSAENPAVIGRARRRGR